MHQSMQVRLIAKAFVILYQSLRDYSFFFTVNKQLADKERVAAALENAHLIEVVNQCLKIRT